MNNIYCGIGITLLFTSIFMFFPNMKGQKYMGLYNKLTAEQKKKYIEIIHERILIYTIGVVIGILVAGLYYFSNKNDKLRLCKAISIFGLLKLAIYYFSPKKPSLTYSLTTKDQLDAWQDIGTEMKNKWKKSLIIGFISYCFISYSRK